MKSLSTFTQCIIALLFVLCALKAANSAPFAAQTHTIGNGRSESGIPDEIYFRQANDDDSYEDSSEDDGEDDAEQVQQSIIEQQNQQTLEESQEGSDEEAGEEDVVDEVRHRRRRRDTEELHQASAVVTEPSNTSKEQQPSSPTIQPHIETETTSSPSLNRTSVLILIRDALKKVTTVLPTEQVATNALQYFQLFEHFLQQTIESVIEDYDEDDEESTTLKTEDVLPEKPDNEATTEPNSTTIEIEKESSEKKENIALTEANSNLQTGNIAITESNLSSQAAMGSNPVETLVDTTATLI